MELEIEFTSKLIEMVKSFNSNAVSLDQENSEPDNATHKPVNKGSPEDADRYRVIVDLFFKAESGDSDSQYKLGEAYFQGDGTNQDRQEAIKWWKKAALQGHLQAQSRLKSETGKITAPNFQLQKSKNPSALFIGAVCVIIGVGIGLALRSFPIKAPHDDYQQTPQATPATVLPQARQPQNPQLPSRSPSLNGAPGSSQQNGLPYNKTVQYRDWFAGMLQHSNLPVIVAGTHNASGYVLSIAIWKESGTLSARTIISSPDTYIPVSNEERHVKIYVDGKMITNAKTGLSSRGCF